MSDGMSKEEACTGCVHYYSPVSDFPCAECALMFSGTGRNHYAIGVSEKPLVDVYLAKLVDDHWAYIESLLKAHDELPEDIEKMGFHYKSAFKHGWKHAMEYMEECK